MMHELTVMCEKLLVLQHMAPEDQAQSVGRRIGEHLKLGLHVPDERLRLDMAYIIFAALSARNMHVVVLRLRDSLLMLSKHLNVDWRYLMIGHETAPHIPTADRPHTASLRTQVPHDSLGQRDDNWNSLIVVIEPFT